MREQTWRWRVRILNGEENPGVWPSFSQAANARIQPQTLPKGRRAAGANLQAKSGVAGFFPGKVFLPEGFLLGERIWFFDRSILSPARAIFGSHKCVAQRLHKGRQVYDY